MVVFAAEVTGSSRSNLKLWREFTNGVMGQECVIDEAMLREAISASKWILVCSIWVWTNQIEAQGRPVKLPCTLMLFIDERGACIQNIEGRLLSMEYICNAWSPIHIVCLGLSFMHCKNIRQVEAKEDPGERFRRQYKVKKYTYRTLVIGPMKEVLRREGRSETVGLQRALHICRGHFSTYSPEKPLFGRYPGTFWIPDHVRGTKENGEVHKNYEVKRTESET